MFLMSRVCLSPLQDGAKQKVRGGGDNAEQEAVIRHCYNKDAFSIFLLKLFYLFFAVIPAAAPWGFIEERCESATPELPAGSNTYFAHAGGGSAFTSFIDIRLKCFPPLGQTAEEKSMSSVDSGRSNYRFGSSSS